MYKDKFIRLNEPIEASESLILHTVMAAEQRAARKHLHAWRLVGAMAAALFLVVAVMFFSQPAPADAIASNGGMPESTGNFLPLSTARTGPAATCDVDGMTMTLLTSMTDGDRSYILFELRGEKVHKDFELALTLSNNAAKVTRTMYVTPAAFDSVEDSAVFLAVFDNQWYDWSIINQQDGAVNSSYYRDYSGQQMTLNTGDTVTLSIQSYTRKFQDAIDWNPDWSTLTADWVDEYYSFDRWLRFYDAQPLYTICDGFEIVGAGMSEQGAHIVTRYTYDPEDVRLPETVGDRDVNYAFADVIPTHNTKPYKAYAHVDTTGSRTSRHTNIQRLENYCEFVLPFTAKEMAMYDFEASASWQYAPESHEDWSLTFTLGGAQTAAQPQTTTQPQPEDLTLAVSDVTRVNEREFSFVLSVKGDRVDPLTSIDHRLSQQDISFDTIHVEPLDAVEGQSEQEMRYRFSLRLLENMSLDNLGDSLDMAVVHYTSGNRTQLYKPEIDWASFDYTLEKNESRISIGDGIEVAAIGFAEDGRLIVRLRWPQNTPDETAVGAWLSCTDDASGEPVYHYMRRGSQYSEGDYECYDFTFGLTREELDGWQLEIYVWLTDEIVEGNWPFTVDLSPLSAT